MRNSGGTVRERRRGGPGIRPGIVAGSQTALKHSDDRPDQDLTRPGLSRFVINFFLSRAQGGQLYPSVRKQRSSGTWLGVGGKSDKDVYEVFIRDDSLRKLLPDLFILIEIEGVQWLETATCEIGFSLRTQILPAQRREESPIQDG
jgi:hypothetical protein